MSHGEGSLSYSNEAGTLATFASTEDIVRTVLVAGLNGEAQCIET
jgi:hypothetical protein